MAANYIKLIGTDCYFQQCWGIGWVDTQNPKEIIVLYNDNDLKYMRENMEWNKNNKKVKAYVVSHCTPNITNGVFSLGSQDIIIKEMVECTQEEIDTLNKAIDDNGMYLSNKAINYEYVSLNGKYIEKKVATRLYWKNKDEFPIVLDGKRIKYKDLKDCEHGENVVLSGDNGYSHCWSDSTDFDKVMKLIDRMFEERVVSGRDLIFHNSLVRADCEIYGYHFDELGALKISTYSGTKRAPFSQVSNS